MIPGPWQFALLALAAYRLFRLEALDTITAPLRAWLTYPDETAVTLSDPPAEDAFEVITYSEPARPHSWRIYLATLIRCPWCAGFYVAWIVWGLWLLRPHAALFVAVPLAISALIGLTRKNLDP